MNGDRVIQQWVLAVMLLLGFAFRLPYLPKPGFRQDMLYYRSCARYLADHSLTTIYQDADQIEGGIVNYPPVYLLVLQILGGTARLFSPDPFDTTWFLVLLKSVNMLADLALALLLYHVVRRQAGSRAGSVALGLFWMNPGTIYLGSFFGQTDVLFTVFLVLSATLVRSFPFLAGCACGLALGTKLQALPFLPLIFLEPLVRRDYRGLMKLLGGISVTAVLLLAPFLRVGQLRELVHSCFSVSLGWSSSLSVGAFNLWQLHPDPLAPDQLPWGVLFGSDGILPADSPWRFLTYHRLGLALFAASYLLVILGWIRWRPREPFRLWSALAAVALAFFFLPTRIHERYLFPFLAFGVPGSAAGENRFRRLMFLFLSVFFLSNLLSVCPPDSRPVPLEQVHSGASDILAIIGLLSALLWVLDGVGLFHRRGLAAAAVVVLVLGGAFAHRRTVDTPLSRYPFTWIQEWQAPRRDLSLDGNQLQIGDKLFADGIGTHAASRLTFQVPEGAIWLTAWIGADAEVLGGLERTSIVFAVELDGSEVYRSSVFSARSPAEQVPPIPLRGARELVLVTESAGDGNLDDHADWCGLCLEYERH